MSIFSKINELYIYGPVTKEEVKNLPVHHKLTYEGGEIYIGTGIPIDYLNDRLIPRENPTELVEEE